MSSDIEVFIINSEINCSDSINKDNANEILQLLPQKPDYLFTSQDNGRQMADSLGCRHIAVDPQKLVIPANSRQIETNPLQYWQYLPSCVRPHYLRKVCIFGPESTGKTTLTVNLAKHFQTIAVPEYARPYLEAQDNNLSQEDLPFIVRGHIASEEALAHEASKVIFSDTDIITTVIWSNWLYGNCDPWIEKKADERQYDLYLITDVDVPWVEDPLRYLPEDRQNFLDYCIKELEKRDRPYVRISGSWKQRLDTAIKAVENLLASSK
jgi:NadR type nicotinamide-nucleotide adenylyltransferase